MTKAVFYHAGCAVCTDAEQFVQNFLDKSKTGLDIVHLGTHPERDSSRSLSRTGCMPARGHKRFHPALSRGRIRVE